MCAIRPTPSEETACAKQIVATLARHAFRRPVTPQDTETLMSFYQQGRNDGNFDTGIERALQRILADPEFVFRKEAEPANLRRRARTIASAIWNWPRGCRSSCGAASPTTS